MELNFSFSVTVKKSNEGQKFYAETFFFFLDPYVVPQVRYYLFPQPFSCERL